MGSTNLMEEPMKHSLHALIDLALIMATMVLLYVAVTTIIP